jgi:integrase
VASRQREQSFASLTDAQAFQIELTAGKRAQGTMYVDPKAGHVPFLPLCDKFIGGMAKANAQSRETYRQNFKHPAVTELFEGKSVLEAAMMDEEVRKLLNVTLADRRDAYRRTIRRIIVGTLDEAVRKSTIPRHTVSGIEIARRIVSAEQYEQEARPLVTVTDDVVRTLAEGMKITRTAKDGRTRAFTVRGVGIAPWLQRTMGLRIREALGVRKSDFCERADGTRYLHLCWQASEDGRKLVPLKHRQAGQHRDVPVPDMIWDMVQAMPDGPLCPGPLKTPYLGYRTAAARFRRILGLLGIEGVHTHSLRHQFATEALDAAPRELANISQVLGHDSTETTLRAYIHPSKNAEQRIGALMNRRWTTAGHGSQGTRPGGRRGNGRRGNGTRPRGRAAARARQARPAAAAA